MTFERQNVEDFFFFFSLGVGFLEREQRIGNMDPHIIIIALLGMEF